MLDEQTTIRSRARAVERDERSMQIMEAALALVAILGAVLLALTR